MSASTNSTSSSEQLSKCIFFNFSLKNEAKFKLQFVKLKDRDILLHVSKRMPKSLQFLNSTSPSVVLNNFKRLKSQLSKEHSVKTISDKFALDKLQLVKLHPPYSAICSSFSEYFLSLKCLFSMNSITAILYFTKVVNLCSYLLCPFQV